MTTDELRAWASAQAEMPQAVTVLALLAERDRLKAALGPFADWYARYGPGEIDPVAEPAYRRAAELLKEATG